MVESAAQGLSPGGGCESEGGSFGRKDGLHETEQIESGEPTLRPSVCQGLPPAWTTGRARAGFAEQRREWSGEGVSGLRGEGAWRAVLCFLPGAVPWPGERGRLVSTVSRWMEDPQVGPS